MQYMISACVCMCVHVCVDCSLDDRHCDALNDLVCIKITSLWWGAKCHIYSWNHSHWALKGFKGSLQLTVNLLNAQIKCCGSLSPRSKHQFWLKQTIPLFFLLFFIEKALKSSCVSCFAQNDWQLAAIRWAQRTV